MRFFRIIAKEYIIFIVQWGSEAMLMELARILSELKGSRYDGSVIARAHLITGRTLTAESLPAAGLEIKKEHEKSLQVVCHFAGRREYGSMEVMLFLHHESSASAESQVSVQLELQQPAWRCFSMATIKDFVAVAGDTNPIHVGPEAVVPGLLLLQEIKRQQPVRDINLRFFQAARAGEELFWVQDSPQKVTIYGRNKKIAQAVLQGDLENENRSY